jgi:hypothetical protein
MNYKQLIEVEIDKLKFDLNNPRLPKRLHGADENKVIEWMLLDASLVDLIASIASNGFFPGEPLLAIKENEKNYTIIEGNRRLASCKILNSPSLATVKSKTIQSILDEINLNNIPKKLPVFIFEKREDILAYLGYRHVTGVKSWGALPKAKYLFELYRLDDSKSSLKSKCRILAEKIGSRSDYVLKLLTSYELFEILEEKKFFKIENLSEETIEFSNLVDAATRFSNISNYLGINFYSEKPLDNLNIKNFEELTSWLFKRDNHGKTMIGENRNIRLLNEVIKSDRALEEFKESGNIREAYLLTSIPEEIYTESIASCIRSLNNALEVVNHVSESILENSLEQLETVKKLTKKIIKNIE